MTNLFIPFVSQVSLNPRQHLDANTFPGNLGFCRDLQLEFNAAVTFFVGENGSGKSTLLEAIAVLADLPIAGGGTAETGSNHAFPEESLLADGLRLGFQRQPRDRYFFRAENQAYFASLLEQRNIDPYFLTAAEVRADPFEVYGGKSLHHRSHGEAFLSVFENRFHAGLMLMDEPESALSPKRQLALLSQMHTMVEAGNTQFIIATHSPILLTFPGATVITFDHGDLRQIDYADTDHFRIARMILNNPERYWEHFTQDSDP